MKATVFLGGGRITTALLAGLHLADCSTPVIVHDRNPRKLRALKKKFGVGTEPDLLRAADQAKLLIVAVRPNDVAALLADLHALPRKANLIACSLAAGISVKDLQRILGPPVRWARAMPSPVARFGHGLTALTFPTKASRSDMRLVRNFFAQVGEVVEVPERQFDAFTVTYSASHGYHALATLARAARDLGLEQKIAQAAAAHALGDSIVAWREEQASLDALLQEAATPGGIAATVMHAMDKAGYQKIINRGLKAGVVRARQNAPKPGEA